MQRELTSLNRVLRIRRQAARLADAACLRARYELDTAQSELDLWQQRLRRLAAEFVTVLGSPDAAARLHVAHELAIEFDRSRTLAQEHTIEARRLFQETAELCRRRRQDVEVLEKLLDARRFEAERLEERRLSWELEDRALQSWRPPASPPAHSPPQGGAPEFTPPETRELTPEQPSWGE
jgi:hypothetical protein